MFVPFHLCWTSVYEPVTDRSSKYAQLKYVENEGDMFPVCRSDTYLI